MFDTSRIFDWNLDPLVPGDMMTLGLIEETMLEQKVNDMIDFIRANYGYFISSSIIDDQLAARDIDYVGLPRYLKDKIDNSFECH